MAYESLVSIYEEAANEYERFRHEVPTKCPNDNTVLIKKEDGVLFCRFDGWVWDGFNK